MALDLNSKPDQQIFFAVDSFGNFEVNKWGKDRVNSWRTS